MAGFRLEIPPACQSIRQGGRIRGQDPHRRGNQFGQRAVGCPEDRRTVVQAFNYRQPERLVPGDGKNEPPGSTQDIGFGCITDHGVKAPMTVETDLETHAEHKSPAAEHLELQFCTPGNGECAPQVLDPPGGVAEAMDDVHAVRQLLVEGPIEIVNHHFGPIGMAALARDEKDLVDSAAYPRGRPLGLAPPGNVSPKAGVTADAPNTPVVVRRWSGTAQLEVAWLRSGILAATRMAGPPESLRQGASCAILLAAILTMLPLAHADKVWWLVPLVQAGRLARVQSEAVLSLSNLLIALSVHLQLRRGRSPHAAPDSGAEGGLTLPFLIPAPRGPGRRGRPTSTRDRPDSARPVGQAREIGYGSESGRARVINRGAGTRPVSYSGKRPSCSRPLSAWTPIRMMGRAVSTRAETARVGVAGGRSLFEPGQGVLERAGHVVPGFLESVLHVTPGLVAGLAKFLEFRLCFITLGAHLLKLLSVLDLGVRFRLVRLGLQPVDLRIPLIEFRLGFLDVFVSA